MKTKTSFFVLILAFNLSINSQLMAQKFDFNDGTKQGWTMQGAYDENGNGPYPSNFTLGWTQLLNYPTPDIGSTKGSLLFYSSGGHGVIGSSGLYWIMQLHYGDDDEWPESGPKTELASTTTNGSGEFTLNSGSGNSNYNYYHVMETDPAGGISVGAQAGPPGYVKNFNYISYENATLTQGNTYRGSAFWDIQSSTGENELIVTNCDDSGAGSLRDAILYANDNPGPDTIRFQIPKGVPGYDSDIGVCTIAPQSELPIISESLFIDGFSQKEFIGENTNPFGPEIYLNGTLAGQDADGLRIISSNVYILGLTIGHFQGSGILIDGGTLQGHVDGGRISGCYVGVNPRGDSFAANGFGIMLRDNVRNVKISPADTFKNVVSGNTYGGIVVRDTSSHVIIQGNIIGLNRTGMYPIGNGDYFGISFQGQCDSVDVYDNWIGGNKFGIFVLSSHNITIGNNFIGMNKIDTEILELGNESEGVYIAEGAHDNVITENFIRFNGGYGVRIEDTNTIRNKVSHNHISGNGFGGIYNGFGGNLELAPPVISSASATSITGTAIPNATVEIYTDPENQGLLFQGETNSDASGNFTWTGTITGQFTNLTAIAIDDSGNTSAFSQVAVITNVEKLIVTNCDDSGAGSLRDAILYANSNPDPDTIRFQIPKGVPGYDSGIGVWMIAPQSQLPVISDTLFIDGFSQKEFIGEDTNPLGPEIWLNGELSGEYAFGLRSTSGGTDIVGLTINNFQITGILMEGVDGGHIYGCYIGVDFTGSAAAANGYGISLERCTRNVVIAPSDTLKNVISGNTNGGIVVAYTSSHISILGNIIGLDRTGMYTIGNGNYGGICIEDQCDSVTVYDNWIGGNSTGVLIYSSHHITIGNNFIGSNKIDDEILELGNEDCGVRLDLGAHDNLITENFIRFNGAYGVSITGSNTIRNKVSHNHISENGWDGIYNYSGGNLELAPPVISSASATLVTGTAIPNATVEIYTDPEYQGLIFQGETNSDANGDFTWNGTITGQFMNVTAIAIDDSGNTSAFSQVAVITNVEKLEDSNIPETFSLSQNYPNPFNPRTTIQIEIPFAGKQTVKVELHIYNLQGQLIRTLINEKRSPGVYQMQWDGLDEAGNTVPTGIYLYRIRADEFAAMKKMLLMK